MHSHVLSTKDRYLLIPYGSEGTSKAEFLLRVYAENTSAVTIEWVKFLQQYISCSRWTLSALCWHIKKLILWAIIYVERLETRLWNMDVWGTGWVDGWVAEALDRFTVNSLYVYWSRRPRVFRRWTPLFSRISMFSCLPFRALPRWCTLCDPMPRWMSSKLLSTWRWTVSTRGYYVQLSQLTISVV